MTDAPAPGSEEEAAARRNVGKGPFSAAKEPHHRSALCGLECLAVLDAAGATFAWVVVSSAIGGDKSAAKARATRIAEALNRTVFAPDERRLTTTEYENRAGVIVGHNFVYPQGRQ